MPAGQLSMHTMVVTHYIAGADVEWPLMKVIVTFTSYCDKLLQSKFMTENAWKTREFFSYFVATLFLPQHLDSAWDDLFRFCLLSRSLG